MKIKFNAIQDLSDARYASAVMADWIGFSVDGETSISIEKVQEILGWCSGPKLALEVSELTDLNKIKSWMDILPVDGIECTKSVRHELESSIDIDGIEWIETGVDFTRIKANSDSAQLLKINPVDSISIDCQVEIETGRKDYSQWNDFFEELEIL